MGLGQEKAAATGTDRSFYYLTRIPSRQIQHVEEKSKFTGQAELLLTQMILHQTPDWLQEIQNLTNHSINSSFFFFKLKLYKLCVSYLDHAVTIGIGDVRLQASKQGSVVMLEIKVFQSKFGVFDCDLFAHKVCYFHFYGIQKSKAKKNSKPFCIFWSPCRGAALLHAQSVTLGSGCSCHNLALDPSVCKEPETQHTKKKTIGICLYGCAHQHWEFKNSKRVLRGQIRSIVGRYTCLVSRAGPRIHCITDETDCFHRAQDFRVCGRSSSVGKIRLNQPQAPPPFLICLGVSK